MKTNLIEINNTDLEGAVRTTCKEAVALLKQDKVRKAWFRPDNVLSKEDPGSDICYVWLVKDDAKEK